MPRFPARPSRVDMVAGRQNLDKGVASVDLSLLNLICCPAQTGDGICRTPLEVDPAAADPRFFSGSTEDLAEGVLRCGGCGARYPVLCGVPVLLRAVETWIRGNYWFLLGFAGEMGAPLSTVTDFLRETASSGGGLPPRQLYDRRWSTRVAKFVSSYLISHHLGLERLELLGPAQKRLAMEMADAGGPHEVLQGMLNDLEPPGGAPGPALDVGCSVGGMTARLAVGSRLAVGVDISFESLVWARTLLRGRPGPHKNLAPVFTEGDNRVEVPLIPLEGRNCEFVLAGGEALPFADGSFRLGASCNLIDVIDKPPELLDEKKRLLAPGGVLLLSTPFLHTATGVGRCLAPEGRRPTEVLRALLVERGFEVTAERDDVPWVLYHYRRRIDYYQTFCLAARRCAAAGK
jgi:SAM-dependent methyltransferase/uncharacterized protein YbaR (Trm112 family)